MDLDDGTSIIHPKRSLPWVEKYRPEKVDDVAHQEEVVRTLKTAIQTGHFLYYEQKLITHSYYLGNIPHLMFYGPPGTGKTTTILAVARALYGPELFRHRILELNASDDRGIQVIREKVKIFAQNAVGSHKTRLEYIYFPLRILANPKKLP